MQQIRVFSSFDKCHPFIASFDCNIVNPKCLVEFQYYCIYFYKYPVVDPRAYYSTGSTLYCRSVIVALIFRSRMRYNIVLRVLESLRVSIDEYKNLAVHVLDYQIPVVLYSGQ